MKKTWNMLFALILVVGVGVLGYGGYLYIDGKAQEKAAHAEADNVLENRTVTIAEKEEREPTLYDFWQEKQAFEESGYGTGDVIGKILLPSIDGELPIVEGADPDSLMQGVGHVDGTYLPLDNSQSVFSGHRDTVFRGIGNMEIGDSIIVQLPYGDFEYKITDTYIVPDDDLSVIVPHEHDQEILTLTTCYPFDFVGYAPDRYIINAEPTFDMGELESVLAMQDNKTDES